MRSRFQPYIDEVERNEEAYIKGYTWFGRETEGNNYNERGYYYKISRTSEGRYFLWRIRASELLNNAEYHGRTLAENEPKAEGIEETDTADETVAGFEIDQETAEDLNERFDELDRLRKENYAKEQELEEQQEKANQLTAEREELAETYNEIFTDLTWKEEGYRDTYEMRMIKELDTKAVEDWYGGVCHDLNIERNGKNIEYTNKLRTVDTRLKMVLNRISVLEKEIEENNERMDRIVEDYLGIVNRKASNFCYNTFCNFLTSTVVEQYTNANITRLGLDSKINLRIYEVNGVKYERTANMIVEYLREVSANEGDWVQVGHLDANEIVNTIPTTIVAGWDSGENGSGHVAVVYPGYIEEDDSFEEGKMLVYAAGESDPGIMTMGKAFETRRLGSIEYFVLKKDYDKYQKSTEKLTGSLSELIW